MLTKKKLAAVLVTAALVLPLTQAPITPAGAKGKTFGRYKFIDLNRVPKPNVTGAEIITGLEEFISTYPMRQNFSPNNVAAAEFLADEAKGYGFKVKIHELEAASAPSGTVRVVEAIKKGTSKPNEWIALIAHYDQVPQTVLGAYDDASGTNMMRFFGKAFSKVKTNRSIALLWFDAEEDGLIASDLYAEMLEKRGQKLAAAFGFDMVGIGYPAPYCICIYHGPNLPSDPELALPIIEYVNFDYLDFPKGDGGQGAATKIGGEPHVCSCGVNVRNSDESNFAERGYFTMRWTGMKTALDYPGYHQPWDTVPFMEQVARGRENLEQGTENTFLSAWYSAFVVDNL